MVFNGLDRILLTLPNGVARTVENQYDEGKREDGSLFATGFEYEQINYARNTMSHPDLYYIDLGGENINEFTEKFVSSKLFTSENLKIFYNADIANALELLKDESTANLTIPVKNDDLDDFVADFGPLIVGQTEYTDQQTKRGEGYIGVELRLYKNPSADQMIAYHRFLSRMERDFPGANEVTLGKEMGSDYATLFHIAQTHLQNGFEQIRFKSSTYFDDANPNSSLMAVPMEYFDAYAATTDIKKIVTPDYYMRRLLQGYGDQEVRFETIAALANLPNNDPNLPDYDVNFLMKTGLGLGLDDEDRKVFKKAVEHFRKNVLRFDFNFKDESHNYEVETFIEPTSKYIDVRIQIDGMKTPVRIEFEDADDPVSAAEKALASNDLSAAGLGFALLYIRMYLSTFGAGNNTLVEIFDRQVEI